MMVSPHGAQRRGIATIYQEFHSGTETWTIAENVFIGRETRRRRFRGLAKKWRRRRALLLKRLGLELQPMSIVRGLERR